LNLPGLTHLLFGLWHGTLQTVPIPLLCAFAGLLVIGVFYFLRKARLLQNADAADRHALKAAAMRSNRRDKTTYPDLFL